MALMPKKTKADVKLTMGLTLTKLFGAFGAIMVGFLFSGAISKWLQLPFVIYCIIVFFVISKKDKHDPGKPFFKGVMSLFQYLILPKKYETMNGTEYIRTVQKEENRIAEQNRRETEKQQQADEQRRKQLASRFGKLKSKRKEELERKKQQGIKKYSKLKEKRRKEIEETKAKEKKEAEKQVEFICKELNKRRYQKKKDEIRQLKAKIR